MANTPKKRRPAHLPIEYAKVIVGEVYTALVTARRLWKLVERQYEETENEDLDSEVEMLQDYLKELAADILRCPDLEATIQEHMKQQATWPPRASLYRNFGQQLGRALNLLYGQERVPVSDLEDALWSYEVPNSTIRSLVSRLNKKLRELGYRLEVSQRRGEILVKS
jgi:hypothetical protein